MANILLISYLFPPSGGVGIPRAVSYTRYLPQHDCRVFVVTGRRPATPLYDPELLKLVPPETSVSRVFNPELPYAFRDRIWRMFRPPHRHVDGDTSLPESRESPGLAARIRSAVRSLVELVTFPDVQSPWIPFAINEAVRLIESKQIDAVILNIPPYSTFKAVVALRKRYPDLKLIIDLRDDWLGYYLLQFDTASQRKFQRASALERAAIESASYVSLVTGSQLAGLRARYPDQPDEKFFVAPNGFEPDLFADCEPRRDVNRKMIITYFGTVYRTRVYSPRAYLEAMDELPEQVRADIETWFVGRITAESQSIFSDRKSHIRQLGFVSKAEGSRLLQKSDYLLLIVNDPTAHAGKLFDYLGSGRPILGLSPTDGEIAKILERTRTGWSVDPVDKAAIRSMVLTAYEQFKRGGPQVSPDWNAIREFSWPEIVAKVVRTTGLRGKVTEPTAGALA